MEKLRENSTLKKIGLQRGKGWGYKDANATNKKTFVATLDMPYSICKHHTFAKKNPAGVKQG
jgi:aryl-alcohol dehydrogenase-like predicted oxidoreductase